MPFENRILKLSDKQLIRAAFESVVYFSTILRKSSGSRSNIKGMAISHSSNMLIEIDLPSSLAESQKSVLA